MAELKYEDLLKRAREGLPKETKTEEARFEMPKFDSFLEGNKTIITNFTDIARTIGREPAHLQKSILGGAGTTGELIGHRLKFMGQKTTDFLNSKLEEYVKKYVLCKYCGKPDTELRIESNAKVIKCKACGTKYPLD